MNERFEQMAQETAVPNWDVDSREPIDISEWMVAWGIYRVLMRHDFNTFVSPCSDGSIHFYISGNRFYEEFDIEYRRGKTVLSTARIQTAKHGGQEKVFNYIDGMHSVDEAIRRCIEFLEREN